MADTTNIFQNADAQARTTELAAPLDQALLSLRTLAPLDLALADGIERAFRSVKENISQLVIEHTGLADELLRVYEHVGLVFDLTPRLLGLRSEREVVEHLMISLRSVFPDVTCSLATPVWPPSGETRTGPSAPQPIAWTVEGELTDAPDWILAGLQACTERQVRVVHADPTVDTQQDKSVLPCDQAMIAPLFAGGNDPGTPDLVAALILCRHAGHDGWESGEMLLIDSLSSFCGDVIRNFRLVQQLQQMSMDTVRTLISAVDQKDPYTSGHSERVGYYATLLAKEIGFDESQLRTLEWSALLHDVGKIGIRDNVLKKPGKLTPDEFDHIKEHPLRGYEVVRENPHMKDAMDGVLYHHERWDGKGYPTGLAAERIPLQARIIQIADIFDALTTNRAYRDAFSWQRALEILHEEAGTVVDPNLSAAFVRMINRLYVRNPKAFNDIGQPDAKLRLTEIADAQGDVLA